MDLSGRRRAVLIVTAAAVVVVGLLAVALHDGGHPRRTVATADDPNSTSSSEPTTTSTSAPEVTAPTTTHRPTTTSTIQLVDATFQGRAVDPAGHALQGLYVYDATANGEPAARTDAQGRYDLPCWELLDPLDGHPTALVLSGVPIDYFAGPHANDQNWAPKAVVTSDGRPLTDWCTGQAADRGTPGGPVVVTKMQPGGIITGHYEDPYNPPFTFDGTQGTWAGLELELTGLPLTPNRLCAPFCFDLEGVVGAGNTYRIIGVPPGVHRMAYLNGPVDQLPSVTVVAGKTTQHDILAPKYEDPTATSTTLP